MKKILFTKAGYEDLFKEKEDLEQKRIVAVKELSIARDMGDRSENAFYKTARQKLSGIDRRLRQIDRVLRQAQIVNPTTDDTIQIGSRVTLKSGDEVVEYLIVGSHESDLAKGRLSCVSPLGRSLLGKKKDEEVILTLPAGNKHYIVSDLANT